MIKVYKFGPAFDMPDASPFVVKVETYLRMTDQKYEAVTGDVRKAPRKQLPFVDIDGKIICDSTDIVKHLESARSDKLDSHLDAGQAAVALAFKAMLEEYLYFGILFMRWATDDGWAVFEPSLRQMLGSMGVPSLMKGIVANSARKQVVGRSKSQGMGRKPRTEVVATCNGIIDALSVYLSDKKYICGDRLTTYDATAYAFALGLLAPAFNNEIHKHTADKRNIVAYVGRMKEAYWKDA